MDTRTPDSDSRPDPVPSRRARGPRQALLLSWAALGASVTLVPGDPSSIYRGQSTRLEITLSNGNTVAAITGVTFANSLPGTLPNGLKLAGAATYSCTDTAGPTTTPGSGTLSASLGAQAISLTGGVIPARANNTDGTRTLRIPVTAGTSTGSAASYAYTIASGTIPAPVGATNGSCTLTLAIEGNHTNSAYTTGMRTNTINASSDFSNDIGIPAAANATANVTVPSPQGVTKAFSPASLADDQTGSVTITLTNSGDAPLTVTTFEDNPIDGVGNADAAKGLLVTGVGTTCAGGVASVLQTNGNDRGTRLAGGSIPTGGSCTVNANFTATTQAANTPVTYTNSLAEEAVGLSTPGIVSQSRCATLLVADTLPIRSGGGAQMQVADPANAATTCGSGSITAVAGSSSVALNGGTVPARAASGGVIGAGSAGTRTLRVDVVGAAGTYSNTATVAGNETYADGTTHLVNASVNAGLTYTSSRSASKSFTATAVSSGGRATVLVRLQNAGAAALTDVAVTDPLPAGLTIPAGANPVTTRTGATLSSPAAVQVQSSGGVAASCHTEIDVLVAAQGDDVNTIPAGGVTAVVGGAPASNSQPASDTMRAKSPLSAQKAIAGQILDAVIQSGSSFVTGSASAPPGQARTLTIRLVNPNAAALTDTLPTAPGNVVVAATPNVQKTCPGTVTYASGASIPAGGCTIGVDVTAATPGVHPNNTIPAGALQTRVGNDPSAANASLSVSTLGYVSGRVFRDNDVTPDGISGTVFLDQNNNGVQHGADSGLAGVTIELLDAGNNVLASTTTDAAGGYAFTGLPPGTYGVRQPSQPAGRHLHGEPAGPAGRHQQRHAQRRQHGRGGQQSYGRHTARRQPDPRAGVRRPADPPAAGGAARTRRAAADGAPVRLRRVRAHRDDACAARRPGGGTGRPGGTAPGGGGAHRPAAPVRPRPGEVWRQPRSGAGPGADRRRSSGRPPRPAGRSYRHRLARASPGEPVADNASPEGMARNRRIEVRASYLVARVVEREEVVEPPPPRRATGPAAFLRRAAGLPRGGSRAALPQQHRRRAPGRPRRHRPGHPALHRPQPGRRRVATALRPPGTEPGAQRPCLAQRRGLWATGDPPRLEQPCRLHRARRDPPVRPRRQRAGRAPGGAAGGPRRRGRLDPC